MRGPIALLLLGALVSASAPQRLSAQSDVATVAATAAAAWAQHDFRLLVGGGRVEVRIPGVSASGPLPGDQAAALLSTYVRDAVEVEVSVVTAMTVSDISGYAELRRRFRRAGVGEPQEETLLLGFTRSRGVDGSWGPWGVGVVQLAGGTGR
ncbi:MAG: hypothetical protein ABIQ41_05835 [Gemmatimonadales bacterium]